MLGAGRRAHTGLILGEGFLSWLFGVGRFLCCIGGSTARVDFTPPFCVVFW